MAARLVNIVFPTREGRCGPGQVGTPLRAEPCCCDHGAMLDGPGDTCVRCGHYDETTIADTWHARAQQLAHLPVHQLAQAA